LTFQIYGVTIILSIPLGILLAVLRLSKSKILKVAIDTYSWILRGTPLLLQLIFVYYGLTVFGISLSPFVAACLSFVLNYAAYFVEIFRGGIESVDKGQYEASRALSMNYSQTMRRIIIPQTIKRCLPPVCNEAINLVKDTALVAIIGMGDLLRAAKEVFTRDFIITPFIIAAAVYLAITYVIVMIFRKLEKKLSYYE
jgi:polar amino acid transport system permease protein